MPNSLRLELHPAFYLTLAAMVLFIPLKWCAAILTAGVFHEFCHLAAVSLCGGSVSALRIGSAGAVMDAQGLSAGKTLVCTLSGPLGSLLLLLSARWFPRLAICAAMHSAFNLLPIRHLDGGQALRCCCQMLLPPRIAEMVCHCIHTAVLAGGAAAGIYGCFFLDLGFLPLLAAAILILKGTGLKIPCK